MAEASKFKPTIPRGKRLKRLAIGSSPFFGVAALAGGSLLARKRREPPEIDFLRNRVRFPCTPVERALTQHDLQEAGADLEALRRAARRMRGPIERDLIAAEALLADRNDEDLSDSSLQRAARALGVDLPSHISGTQREVRSSLCRKLIEKWHAAGYFSEPVKYRKPTPSNWIGPSPLTGEYEAYGRDIGCEVPLCMLSATESTSASNRLQPRHWGMAADALEQHGVVLLSNFLTEQQLISLRQHLNIVTSALDTRSKRLKRSGNPSAGPVREYDTEPLQDIDPDLEYVTSTHGRKHFLLRGSLLESVVCEVQAAALPLVWEHLAPQNTYVSEVQLLVTEPGAMEQFWHMDNASRGLTLFVPLTPVPIDVGPTLVIPGSHHLSVEADSMVSRAQKCASSMLCCDGTPAGTMDAGDALIYDARTFHRCIANRSFEHTRIALVFRYDFERPPGYGATGTLLVSWAGNALERILAFYAKLP